MSTPDAEAARTADQPEGAEQDNQARARLMICLLSVLLGAGYLLMALDVPRGSIERPGPGVFPLLAGGLAVFAGLLVSWESRGAIGSLRDWRWSDRTAALRWLLFTGSVLVGIVLMPLFGFSVGAFVPALTVLRLTAQLGWIKAVLGAAAIAVLTHLAFVELFAIQLPPFPLIGG
ncbi:tripartite tricarboxylate transporter TctB family protein [Tamaricihabitans halophyticus]|uniref:Tripartite tricarboxylate transporter TctB family protein n=1 Tax=Tamaricihabitans halophyticus TaxID=1262583 RepID=A0A4R2QYW0_9PSEU|nr:tripartite tricarboxylate transporter TctB family protein [Tamaricihabitans halophyticus]TCP54258.1 tripartite tricarboxylate transporter TctB family protein [Tamaricihabitans halophyticus]